MNHSTSSSSVTDAVRLAQRLRPIGKSVMPQSWQKLLFLHWRFDPALVQALLPAGLSVDTYEGSAWVGMVSFFMRGIRPFYLPDMPHLSNFLELNLRTYAVDEHGIPGVWFISLNANRWLACQVARSWFRLPYHWCSMSANVDRLGLVDFYCHRRGQPVSTASLFQYVPQGDPVAASPGTLEFFLAERYVLFAPMSDGKLGRGYVHHAPYPLQNVQVLKHNTQLFQIDGWPTPCHPFDHACYSEGVTVEVFPLSSEVDPQRTQKSQNSTV